MEEKLLKALVDAAIAFVVAHPRIAGLVGSLYAIALLWKMQPKEKRDAWTKQSPRFVGAIRAILELAPDFVGFVRVVVYQIVKGLAARSGTLSISPDSIPGTIEDGPGPGPREQAAVINNDGTASEYYVASEHVRGCDCDACKRSTPGFTERGVIAVIAGVAMLALGISLLTGCPIPPPDGCPPRATRCSPSGVPQSCTLGQYWSSMRPEHPCSAGSVCCYTRSPYGRELHACVPPEDCLPEPAAADAGAEGGAQ